MCGIIFRYKKHGSAATLEGDRMKNEKVAIMEKTEFNLIRLISRNGVSLLAKTRKDNTLVEYLVEENSNNGELVYGVGDDLHVAFMIFLRFIETAKKGNL